MSTRIPPLEAPFTEDVEADFNIVMPPGMPPLSIFKTVAHNPRVLHRMVRGGLLDKGSISLADRELVILRTCGLYHAFGFMVNACRIEREPFAPTFPEF